MADITNEQIIHFANEKCRVLANLIERARRTSEQFAIEIVAIEALSAYSAATENDVIADGSAIDGRKQVDKANIAELKFVAAALATALNTDDREQLVANWTTDSTPLF